MRRFSERGKTNADFAAWLQEVEIYAKGIEPGLPLLTAEKILEVLESVRDVSVGDPRLKPMADVLYMLVELDELTRMYEEMRNGAHEGRSFCSMRSYIRRRGRKRALAAMNASR